MTAIEKAFQKQYERMLYYSPYNYLREIGKETHFDFLRQQLNPWLEAKQHYFVFETSINNADFYFLYRYLPWDTEYFRSPTYKLFLVLYKTEDYFILEKAVEAFKKHLNQYSKGYCFGEIPAEDSLLLQAFTANNFRLAETRLNYYYDQVNQFNYERFPVRPATENDIPLLRKTAAENRNNFDRYHADIFFTPEQADHYLATYAEACQKTLADLVLLPAEKDISPEAFMAISRLSEDAAFLKTGFARILLTAVGPACKGWHLKLAAETIQQAKAWDSRYVLMTTQATNRAVFRTSEKLGFKLGSTTHLLSLTF